jgi:hypothetical protein
MSKWQCRIAPSLGDGFAGTPESVWGTVDYKNDIDPTVFFGMYGLPDFYTLWRHKGRKCILWAGSDIRHFINGYWLDNIGEIRLQPYGLAKWINSNCESYVENKVEQEALKLAGIKSKVVPSFLGDVNKFPRQELKKEKRYYSSVSGNDFKLYGWDKINDLAKSNPQIQYYLYGNTIKWKAPANVIVRGRVSQQQMDEETKSMTGAIVMTEFCGFSEILAKSILWGQKPISVIKYNYTRKSLLLVLNKYPWNIKK